MFSIKQVATSLQMSTQAIYKQKDELIAKGYMEKNKQGNWEITDTGFNYLQDKKIAYMQQHTTNNIQPVANQPIKEEVEETEQALIYLKENLKETENKATNLDTTTNDKVTNLLINHYKEQLQTITNQLQEMTQQRDYFKAKFEEKDTLCNQYMNSHLLPPIEDELERNSRENKNKGFFWKLFNK